MRTFLNHTSDYLPFLMDADKEGAGGSAADDDKSGTGDADKGTAGADDGADKSGDNGNSGADKNKKTPTIEEQIAAAVALEVAGLKKKRDELLAANKALKEQTQTALTPEEFTAYKEMQARIAQDELLKLMSEGKSEEAIAIATRRAKAEADAVLAVEREATTRAVQEAAAAKAELETTKISIAVAQASASIVKPQYQTLVETLIKGQVKVVDGVTRVVDAEGEVVLKGGKPQAVSDLIESLRPNYPDLFHTSAGGGAGGSTTKTQTGGKISMEAAADLDPGEFMRLRNEGKF